MCDPQTHAERGTGAAARGIDPDIDRAVERSIVPTTPPGARMPGAGSGVVPPPSADRLALEASLRQRERVLSQLSGVLRREAPAALAGDARVVRAQATITGLETEFREIARRSGTELSAADRARALALLDEAYEVGEGQWGNARSAMWRGVYSSPEGRAIIDREIAAGRMRLSSDGRARGLAPEFHYRPPGGAGRWITIDIDHMIPRDRVPFYTFQPRNFHLQVDQFNRQWLNRFGAATPFPMGRYADLGSDALEEFVQRFSLSRRQRPERRRRSGRGGAAAGGIAVLLMIISSGARAATYAELAAELRASERRGARRHRRSLPVEGIDLFNLRSHVERGLEVAALDIDNDYLNQLLRAAQHWVRRDYSEGGGDWEQDFTRRFHAAVAAQDEDAFNRLLDNLGGYLIGGVRGRLDELADVEGLLTTYLGREGEYLRAASEAAEMTDMREEWGEAEAAAYAISIDDLMTIVDHGRAISSRLRTYVHVTRELLALVRVARDGDLRRRGRVQDAIERAAAVHDAQARAGTAARR